MCGYGVKLIRGGLGGMLLSRIEKPVLFPDLSTRRGRDFLGDVRLALSLIGSDTGWSSRNFRLITQFTIVFTSKTHHLASLRQKSTRLGAFPTYSVISVLINRYSFSLDHQCKWFCHMLPATRARMLIVPDFDIGRLTVGAEDIFLRVC